MKKVIREFKSGGLYEKHVVATCKLRNHLSIRFETQANQEKPVSMWLVAGPSDNWLLAGSPESKVKQQYTRSTKNTHKVQQIHIRYNKYI